MEEKNKDETSKEILYYRSGSVRSHSIINQKYQNVRMLSAQKPITFVTINKTDKS